MTAIEEAISYMVAYGSKGHLETAKMALLKYDKLKKGVEWLWCLEAAGVDSWSGIDCAHKIWRNNHSK